MRYPDIVLNPESSNSPLLVPRLCAGVIDVAFVWLPISESDDLILAPLVDEEFVIVLPPRHPMNGSRSAPLAALAKEPFILPPREVNPGVYDSIISACHRAGFDPKLGPAVPQVASTVPIVAAGLGVSIVPRCISRIHADGISYLRIEDDAPRAAISLAYRRGDRSSTTQNFVEVARRKSQTAVQRKSKGVAIEVKKAGVLRR
jgi:DNA-binding transcriptional LysR family regulator